MGYVLATVEETPYTDVSWWHVVVYGGCSQAQLEMVFSASS